MGRRLTASERFERKKEKRLIAKIRKHPKYIKWKKKILKRDVLSYPEIPKGIQVHHKKEITKWLRKYSIKSVEEALECEPLWELEVGITLKRGEHFIMTKLSRYKYVTKGFRKLILSWLKKTVEDRLDYGRRRISK